MLVLGAPGRLLTAYSNDMTLEDRVELDVELPYSCPNNGTSSTWLWQQLSLPPPGAMGSAKIRSGYDYRELLQKPTSLHPHSTCPGDCFMSDVEQDAAQKAELAALVYR
jgi:hypothetical protein